MLKIDVYNHFLPPPYFEKMNEVAPGRKDLGKRVRNIPCLVDLDVRFKIMDEFGDDYRQILSTAAPAPEEMAGPDVSPDLAAIGNDALAEIVAKHPDRFAGFIATLPMNNPDEAVKEIDRAINDLGACGAQLYTNVAGRPLDEPEFEPVFAAIAAHDLPMWMHPERTAAMPDYKTEERSKYEVWWTFGWPYETSTAMARMVFSGLFDRVPNLKIITHHLGGMVPYFEGRVGPGWDQLGTRTSDEDYTQVLKNLKKPHMDYFKNFYADTAVFGSVPATKCGLDFFGAEQPLLSGLSRRHEFEADEFAAGQADANKLVEALVKLYRENANTLTPDPCTRPFMIRTRRHRCASPTYARCRRLRDKE